MKDNYKKLIVNRIVITVVLILVQVVWIMFAMLRLSNIMTWISTALNIVSILVVLHIIGKEDNSAYKIGWIVLIMALPLFGGLFYLFSGDKKPSRGLRRKLSLSHEKYRDKVRKDGVGEELSLIHI